MVLHNSACKYRKLSQFIFATISKGDNSIAVDKFVLTLYVTNRNSDPLYHGKSTYVILSICPMVKDDKNFISF